MPVQVLAALPGVDVPNVLQLALGVGLVTLGVWLVHI